MQRRPPKRGASWIILSMIIVCALFGSQFLHTDHGAVRNLAGDHITQEVEHVTDAVGLARGYVEYTLFLSNGTLLAGNVVANVSGIGPAAAFFDQVNGYVYVTNFDSGNVSVIDGVDNRILTSIPVGSGPDAAAFDPYNDYLYVVDSNSNSVSVINSVDNKLVSTIPVGATPFWIAFDPTNGYVYVTNFDSNSVSVINSTMNRVVSSIPVGDEPSGIAIDPFNGYVYVTNFDSGNVSVINGSTDRVVYSIPVGSDPNAAAFDPLNDHLYVTDETSNNLSVIDVSTGSVISSIPVGSFPLAVAFDASNGYVYVANGQSNTISVINGTTDTTVSNISVGVEPTGMAIGASGAILYVANFGSGSISIVATGKHVTEYSVVFYESGLSPGTKWSVTFNGLESSSYIDVLKFTVPNGTYLYSIGSVHGYTPSRQNGSVFVNGKNVTVTVKFTTTQTPVGVTRPTIMEAEIYGIVTAIIAIGAVAYLVSIARRRK